MVSTSSMSSAPRVGPKQTPARPATTAWTGSTRSRLRCPAANTGPSSKRCAAPSPRRWPPGPTSWSRPGPGPASRSPTLSRRRSAARRSSSPRRRRRCRTSWPRRTCLGRAGLGLPAPLDFAVLKGRSNYVCRQRVAEVGSGGIQAELGDQGLGRADEFGAGRGDREAGGGAAPPEGIVDEVRQLVAWSQTSTSGDRADLSFEPSDRAWNMVSVGPRECPGMLQLPFRWSLLRRGRPRTGIGGRHRGGQHPPLRRTPGQRRCGAARTRRGHLRRGPRARGGHDVEPRGRDDAGPFPLPRDLRPLPRRAA